MLARCRCCSKPNPSNAREGHQTGCQRLLSPPTEQRRVSVGSQKDSYCDVISWFSSVRLHLQWQVDSAEGDFGRMLCRDVPGDRHHTDGDVEDPAAGCWQTR